MSDDLKADGLLPPNATRPEDALAATAFLADQVDDPIGLMLDPWTVPVEALPHLAWALRVPVWDSSWPETKQRSIIAQSPELNYLKGKVLGVKRYVDIMGGRVTAVRLPPEGIYLDEGWSQQERAEWRARFAEVRVHDRPGFDVVPWDFFGEAYFDDDDDTGAGGVYLAPYEPKPKHRAVHVDGAIERDLELVEVRSVDVFGTVHIVERLFERGYLASGLFGDLGWFDIDYFDEPEPLLFLEVDGGRVSGRPGFDAPLVSNRPEPVVETAEVPSFFLDCSFDWDYLDVSIADRMIYDSYRLYDPARSTGVPEGGYCLDDPVVFALPPNHMLVDVDARHVVTEAALFLDHSYFSDYLVPDDGAYRQRLINAVAAANETSDKTLVSTTLHRPIRFSDGKKFGEFKFGELIDTTEIRDA